jgi:hypothetical protein
MTHSEIYNVPGSVYVSTTHTSSYNASVYNKPPNVPITYNGTVDAYVHTVIVDD